MERLQRTRLLSVVILGVIFATGVSLGVALDQNLDGPDELVSVSGEQAVPHSEGERTEVRRVPMYRQVGTLTAEQDARIDSIMEIRKESVRELRNDFDDFRDKYNSRMWEISEGARGAIKEVLTSEQAARYDSLLTAYNNSRRRGEDSDQRRP